MRQVSGIDVTSPSNVLSLPFLTNLPSPLTTPQNAPQPLRDSSLVGILLPGAFFYLFNFLFSADF